MIKSYKIRLYPTPEQEAKMWQHIGASRFIYNYMLDLQIKRHENGEKHLSAFDMNKQLTPLKKQEDFQWLNEMSNTTLQRSCSDLSKAYDAFFRKQNKFPKFKSKKKTKPSFPVCDIVGKTYLKDGFVHLQKIGKVKYKSDLELPQGNKIKFSNPRITYQKHNKKWILSFGLECENQVYELTDKSMGIDLGVKDLAVVAFGDEKLVFYNINKSRTMKILNQKAKRLQRSISRKYEASRKRNGSYVKTKNIEKQEQNLRKLYARIANIRQNYLHQITHKLAELLPYRVVMEDLNVSGMMKNRHLSKAIGEQGFYEFIRQMQYKCEWRGIEFVQVDRFYPSSKTCSICGCIKSDLKLKDRVFACADCGATIDRDYNAAINLARYVA